MLNNFVFNFDSKILLTFDSVGQGLYSFDTREPQGFAIAGADRQFQFADAKIVGKDTVQVSCDEVKKPVAVRYGWAPNPDLNLTNSEGLPAAPFRSDDWDEPITRR